MGVSFLHAILLYRESILINLHQLHSPTRMAFLRTSSVPFCKIYGEHTPYTSCIHDFSFCNPQALIPPIEIHEPNSPFAHFASAITSPFTFNNLTNKAITPPRFVNFLAKSSSIRNGSSIKYGSITPCSN